MRLTVFPLAHPTLLPPSTTPVRKSSAPCSAREECRPSVAGARCAKRTHIPRRGLPRKLSHHRRFPGPPGTRSLRGPETPLEPPGSQAGLPSGMSEPASSRRSVPSPEKTGVLSKEAVCVKPISIKMRLRSSDEPTAKKGAMWTSRLNPEHMIRIRKVMEEDRRLGSTPRRTTTERPSSHPLAAHRFAG